MKPDETRTMTIRVRSNGEPWGTFVTDAETGAALLCTRIQWTFDANSAHQHPSLEVWVHETDFDYTGDNAVVHVTNPIRDHLVRELAVERHLSTCYLTDPAAFRVRPDALIRWGEEPYCTCGWEMLRDNILRIVQGT